MAMEEVKRIVVELLQNMDISFDEIETSSLFFNKPVVSIKTKESNFLIGAKGEYFLAFSHIIKKMASKVVGEDGFSVDVNDYQKNNFEKLKQKALVIANRARSFNTSIEMEPMSSYERMLVHSFFGEISDISTESIGVGKDRRVKIKYNKQDLNI